MTDQVPSSIDFDLAEALVEALQAALPNEAATIKLSTKPRPDRKDVTGYETWVSPAAWLQLPREEWRDIDEDRRLLHVAVIGPAVAKDPDSVRAGCEKVDVIKSLWAHGGPLRDYDLLGHVWIRGITQQPLWHADLLATEQLFVAVLTLTYRLDGDGYESEGEWITPAPGPARWEPALGDPSIDGQVLASTVDGVRTWVTLAGVYSLVGHTHAYLTQVAADLLYAAIGHTHTQPIRTVGITVDGSGTAINAAGSRGFVVIPFAGTITRFYLVADKAGSVVLDVKRGGVSIIGTGNRPTLAGAQRVDAAPSGWTSATITANDELEFYLDSSDTLTRVFMLLEIQT